MRSLLVMTLIAVTVLSGCGGSGNPTKPAMAVVLTPSVGLSLVQGTSFSVSAQVNNDAAEAGVSWTLAGDGALVNPTPFSVTYVAPTASVTNPIVVLTATSLTDSSSQTYIPITLLPPATLANVQSVSVDGGPVPGKVLPNAAYTTISVCVPGTITCQSIDGILVDTGSAGLRILSSALPALPAEKTSDGNPMSECVQFPDQSYLWGNVVSADVRIGGEVSRALPIQALTSQNGSTVPSDCSGGGGANVGATQATLGANGILGVGYEPQDCGKSCDPSAGGSPPAATYYGCSSGTCTSTFVPVAKQVTNPIVTFYRDNNGLALQFPGLSGVSTKIDGVMTFGIQTEVNNQLGNATIFTLDAASTFTTNLGATGQSLTASQIDSGLNALFFPDDGIPACAGSSAFFCPATSTPLSAMQLGANGSEGTINFSVDNADALFSSNTGAAAFSGLAGPNGTGTCSGNTGACQFQWGLPFFYGRTVFTSIRGQSVPVPDVVPPLPPLPSPPWFAYTTGFTKN